MGRPTEQQIDDAHEAALDALRWVHACCPDDDAPNCVECGRLLCVVMPLLDLINALSEKEGGNGNDD